MLDTVGGYGPASLRLLRPGGTFVSIRPGGTDELGAAAAQRGIRAVTLIVEAHRLGETGRTAGKIVLTVP